MRLNPARLVSYKEQNKQGNRKGDSHSQGIQGSIGLALVFHKEDHP